jgi:phosphatidylserine decarboxylase
MTIFAALASAIVFFIFWFNRNPDRSYPDFFMKELEAKDRLILSPSDGRVLYIRKFSPGSVPVSTKFKKEFAITELEDTHLVDMKKLVIGIYLSPFDVHITRAPISGSVTLTKFRKGRFFSRNLVRFTTLDEMSTCVIKGRITSVAVVQLAAYAVRRVVLDINIGQTVVSGDRIGKIRMGSQVDLVLEDHEALQIFVKPGDKVRAGQSLIAKIESHRPANVS